MEFLVGSTSFDRDGISGGDSKEWKLWAFPNLIPYPFHGYGSTQAFHSYARVRSEEVDRQGLDSLTLIKMQNVTRLCQTKRSCESNGCSKYNVALPPAILSRFDLVYVMIDDPDDQTDYIFAW
ncbi:hypothetical protein ACFE04_004552 [Oxalis oulophora]